MSTTHMTYRDHLEEALKDKKYHTGGYPKIHPDYWVFHGEYYDLTEFIQRHPGGAENLRLVKGRDGTELYESVHSLTHKNMRAILDKYRIPTPEGYLPPPTVFTWEKGGFYDVLKLRVRDYFDSRGGNHKATWGYWAKIALILTTWFLLVKYTLNTGNFLTAFLAGSVMNMLGFCGMHDASHYGVSYKVWVNRLIHTAWCNWNLWSHFTWLRHHVYGHHSYTGIFKQDPDLVNGNAYYRKHPNDKYRPAYTTQHLNSWLVLGLTPNQHVGQALVYFRALFRKTVFGVPMLKLNKIDIVLWTVIFSTSIYFHFFFIFNYVSRSCGIVLLISYWAAQGLGYMCNVIPNHDTVDTHHAALQEGEKRDWGVHQVLASGNHSNDGGLWSIIVSNLWGGMNHQIEHHLFPSVSHVHHPEVGKIVRKTCEEFKVNYVTHSWAMALWRYTVLLWVLSFPRDVELKAKQN